MIIFTNEKNIESNIIKNEINHVNWILDNELKLKELLNTYIDKTTASINRITNPADIDSIHTHLFDLKTNFDNLTNLISSLYDLLKVLNAINEPLNLNLISDYNMLYEATLDRQLKLNSKIYSFINTIHEYMTIEFPGENIQEETSLKENDSLINLREHSLIISEKTQNIILPYSMNELKEKQKNENITLQAVIEKYYTKPLAIYKNTPLARFKEAFSLIREREKGSLKKALDLGLELFFKFDLHPAIITACKNIDELDIYLDYLENGETDKFNCFEVVFEFAPVLSKKEKRFSF